MRIIIYNSYICDHQDTIFFPYDTVSVVSVDTNKEYSHFGETSNAIDTLNLRSVTNSTVFQKGGISSLPGNYQGPKKDSLFYQDIPYFISDTSDYYLQNNILENFDNQYYFTRDPSPLIFREDSPKQIPKILTEYSSRQVDNNSLKTDMNPDWLLGIIIISLVVITWLKLFYHKFFNQTFSSLWNFQSVVKSIPNQGIFSRRIAFILNLHFVIIFGLFTYLVLTYFGINPYNFKHHTAYLIYTCIIAILLLIRYIVTLLIGHIFNRLDLFRGYLHQLLLIYKNIGIIFIPLVFCIAYMQENVRIFLIIIGIILFMLAYLFRIFKGFQLIIKKDILIFYLILYLCTLEILPVLIYYKLFSSWI